MANRNTQNKIRKMKKRGRYAVFSGASSKYATRIDRGKYDGVAKVGYGDTEDLVPTGKHVVIPVGPISSSKQVMSTGRGPDAVKMQEYYQRIHSYDQALPETLGFTGPMLEVKAKYDEIVRETPKEMRIRLFIDEYSVLDLYFIPSGHQFFFVEVNLIKKFIRRSTIYSSKTYAMIAYKNDSVTWVETVIPKR